ncbi:hypothetical protein [Streptomyces sp. GQFP]|nr:hypothetical protein [Streptomyces sp. GQFP]
MKIINGAVAPAGVLKNLYATLPIDRLTCAGMGHINIGAVVEFA